MIERADVRQFVFKREPGDPEWFPDGIRPDGELCQLCHDWYCGRTVVWCVAVERLK